MFIHLSMLSSSGVRLPTRIWLQGCPVSRDFVCTWCPQDGYIWSFLRCTTDLCLPEDGKFWYFWLNMLSQGLEIWFFLKKTNVKIPTPMPDPPHLRLHIDVWIRIPREWGILQVVPSTIRISMNFYFIFCNFEVGSSSLFIFSIKLTNLNLYKT